MPDNEGENRRGEVAITIMLIFSFIIIGFKYFIEINGLEENQSYFPVVKWTATRSYRYIVILASYSL